MGYLYLCIALMAGITKGYCGKKTGNFTSDTKDAMAVNFIRMLLCILIGFALILVQGQFQYIAPDISVVAITLMSGIFTSLFVVTWLLSVKTGAYLMVEVFLMLGVLIPIFIGSFAFNESVALNEWIGIALLILATIIMCSYNNTQKQKLSLKAFALLVICGASNGLADFSQKLFVKSAPQIPISVFNFYTYVFSALFLLPLLFILGKKANQKLKSSLTRVFTGPFGYILIMAICLFANSYFKTKAAVYLDSAQLYPLNQGAALILSAIMSSVLFREKFTFKCFLGLTISFIGLLVINLL